MRGRPGLKLEGNRPEGTRLSPTKPYIPSIYCQLLPLRSDPYNPLMVGRAAYPPPIHPSIHSSIRPPYHWHSPRRLYLFQVQYIPHPHPCAAGARFPRCRYLLQPEPGEKLMYGLADIGGKSGRENLNRQVLLLWLTEVKQRGGWG